MQAKLPTTLAMLIFGSLGAPAFAADEQKFLLETWSKQKIQAFGGSGTLDGRTFIESQREAVAGLRNLSLITVKNAGHNLFDDPSGELQEAIDRFMEGKSGPSTETITMELPDLAPTPARRP